jgi:Family of unknown function (DUF6152)
MQSRGSTLIRNLHKLSTKEVAMKQARFIAAGALAAILGMVSIAAVAHHGWSGYDSQQVLKLTGTVEEPSYSNPHGSVRLKTPEKSWVVVLAPPSRMQARGLTKDMLKAGITVTVEGYPHLKDASELRAERITIDGKTIELR